MSEMAFWLPCKAMSLNAALGAALERPRKYSTFLFTLYPVSVDPSKAKELLAGFIRMVYLLIDLFFSGVSLRHHCQLLPSVSFRASHPVTYGKCRMSNHGVTNVGSLGTFPDTALHLRSAHDSCAYIHRTPPSAAASN